MGDFSGQPEPSLISLGCDRTRHRPRRARVDESANRPLVERLRATIETGVLQQVDDPLLSGANEDLVLEGPPSVARIPGVANRRAVSERYASATGTSPTLVPRRLSGAGDSAVVEATIDHGAEVSARPA